MDALVGLPLVMLAGVLMAVVVIGALTVGTALIEGAIRAVQVFAAIVALALPSRWRVWLVSRHIAAADVGG